MLMKRTASALILILALLISVVAQSQFAFLVMADDANQNLPTIDVLSPIESQIYNPSDVWLNFTVNKPETWFKLATGYDNPILITTLGQITFVRYNLDGIESANISANDAKIWTINIGPPRKLDFSVALPALSDGQHNLTVTVYGLIYVSHTFVGSSPDILVTAPVVANSSSINFAVYSPPGPRIEPFPATSVAATAVLVAVVTVGLLLFFKKRNKYSKISRNEPAIVKNADNDYASSASLNKASAIFSS